MEKQKLRFKVNNDEYEVYIHPKTLLVEVIRDHLGFTGTKRGCETVSCGACTVNVNGASVKSCSVLAIQCEGMEVTTVEGLEKDGKLSPIQKSFLDHGSYQCGFCTPGMLMSASAFIAEAKSPTKDKIKESIEGNVCRCTGYNSIVRAIEAVTQGKYKEE
ncbi:MAG: carbon monoxide dehydrogenase small chain [Deltaproteobacteria bacterium]|nr:carbon monoxide dehydrogenase small chain [Deltaproteobacteria bacterium]